MTDIKKIKIFFYALFAADIAVGAAIAFYLGMPAGIITAAVLLILNITFYAIILKIQKAKEQYNGRTKEK